MKGFYFDSKAADMAEAFFANLLFHTKGIWAGKPFILLPWQRQVVRRVFGWKRPDGTRKYRTVYIEIAKKNGKALSIDTPIPVPQGWKTIEQISVGDIVFDEKGNQCNVIGTTENQYNRPCYEITFNDGTSIIADAAHEWYVNQLSLRNGGAGSKPVYVIRETEQMTKNLFCGKARNYSVDVAEPLAISEATLAIPPYVLGCWLGDGHSASARITISHKDSMIIDHIRECGIAIKRLRTSKENCDSYLVGSLGKSQKARNQSLQAKLRKFDLLNNKHIPPAYLRASIEQRMSLLQGLMDTDGYCSEDGQCEFTTTIPFLRNGFMDLCRSLGYKPTFSVARAKIGDVDYGDYYRIQFFAYCDCPVFKLERHIRRLKVRPETRQRSSRRHIVSIEKVDSVPVKCIQVDSPSHLFLAGESMIPTHNSTFAAGIALYLLFADGEFGAEVYSAAGDRYQAGIVYETAREMVKTSSELAKRCESMRRSIFVRATFSRYEALSREAGTKHGINAHGIIFDELHVQKNRELWDTLTSADSSRSQPLTVAITTAGWDRTSICREVHDYALNVRDKIIEDDEFLPVIFAAGENDDWTDPRTWRKANPSLGITISEDYLRRKCEKAQRIPGYQNTFKRLHLDLWTEQADRWIDLVDWDACANGVSLEDLSGQVCFSGLDLSSTRDLTALALISPPETEDENWKFIPRFYMPADNIGRRVEESKVPYDQWIQQGYIIPTPGNVVDYEYIRKDLEKLGVKVSIKELALDRWNSTYLMTQLMEDGLKVVPFGQGFASMSGPSKEWEKLVISHKIQHDGNPVMRWMMSNVAVKEDPAGNIKPDKSRSSEKIDGVVAGIMALGRAIFEEGETPSVYEERGQLIL